MRRIGIIVAALAGAGVGVFWLIAIDAGVNGKNWPPNSHTWAARVTCPFIPLFGLNSFMNFFAPILNACFYAITAWAMIKLMRRRTLKM